MKRLWIAAAVVCAVAAPLLAGEQKAANWNFNATIIEACSCPMFCQCYFNSEPGTGPGHAAHAEGEAPAHFCQFNNAFMVNRGKFGNVKLDGAKFWIAGDLGAEFTDGEMDWAVITFDAGVTPEQREAIGAILGHVYPVKWKSFTNAPDAKMEWSATKEKAVATLDGGKTAEVVLASGSYGMGAEPVVIKNLRYFGAPRNDGFVLMKNEVEAYRAGEKPFEFKGTNGFMITLDITSKDVNM